MKKNPNFSLHVIAQTAYLLPNGQAIADHKRGIRLNETGVFLWTALQRASSRQELLERFARHYDADPKDLPLLEQDLEDFLGQLAALGILLEEETVPPVPSYLPRPKHTEMPDCPKHGAPPLHAPGTIQTDSLLSLSVGPLRIHVTGPADAFAAEFLPFQAADAASADLTIECMHASLPVPETMTLLIQNAELYVYETADQYFLLFPNMLQLRGAVLDKSGCHAAVYYSLPFSEQFPVDLFHVIRLLFLYTAQKHGCFALHSASILYQGQAWLFSGHSGMGKSTHANLWKEMFQVPVFNGDLNLLTIADGLAVVYGLPWCGTSGTAGTGTYPLGGIVLLNQASYNECMELPLDKKILLAAQRLISPAWDSSMLQRHLDFMSVLAAKTQICLLKCTKEPAAAKAMKQWIDGRNINCVKID